MTRQDALQHAAVWAHADSIVMIVTEKSQETGSTELVAALLAAAHLADAVSKSYDILAKSLP